ncbi:hypothetical protein ASE92_05040 [Pedobacter sp. Leaf41]|jgi:hypothetical protein|uniref:hypothetical protein n=1 Tax=Pedobacter sp. Leaf41 TaxID=1736218 RepID=UPI0007033594|nr:hypothetical protein [Pedobacter sp. Leaf41]KQN38788.1 hypothetical protein ASE92_05040 [Pedobacter sp. Leaf41]
MKKILLFLALVSSTNYLKAQNKNIDSLSQSIKLKSEAIGHGGNNEIKINLFYSILALPEITYERIIEDNMGVGLSVAIGATNENVFGSKINYVITPHYRIYFGNKKANGFFIEGNAGIISHKEFDYTSLAYTSYPAGYDITLPERNYTDFGLGAAAGAKFLTRNGFLGEAYLGVGRVFGSKNQSLEAYPRFGLTIGKRF